jgi:hypothetical protein
MTSPQFGEAGYNPAPTPEQFAAVKEQVQPPPVGVGINPDDMAAKLSGAMPFEVDVEAMIKAAVAAEVKRIMAQQGSPEGEHNLIGASAAARELIAHHFFIHPKKDEILRQADDLVDAARNSVASGDTGPARLVAGKLERTLNRYHPGPGDHHYFRQALGLVSVHVPDAADTITEAQPGNAPAVTSSQPPARVLQGSVTG